MDIYYKKNTGIKNPQGSKLDYFVVATLGTSYQMSQSIAEVLFYEILKDAQDGIPAPAQRICHWNPSSDSTTQMRVELFALAEVSTTAGEVITLNNPTPQ